MTNERAFTYIPSQGIFGWLWGIVRGFYYRLCRVVYFNPFVYAQRDRTDDFSLLHWCRLSWTDSLCFDFTMQASRYFQNR